MEKIRKLTWKCHFTEFNSLCLRDIYVTAPSLSDVLIELHKDLKGEFIASHLLEISFYSVCYE